MQRTIVHCDLDTFFVSVERLLNSSLIGQPVLVGADSDRGVVASCSYEARQLGVHSAMPMKMAKQLCPEAVVVRGDFDVYSRYSHLVTEIIQEHVPIVEKASIDEHYLDLTEMERFHGTWKLTKELRQCIIKETGLPISFGLSSNKTVSKIATGEVKPSGELKVDYGGEKSFLAPLSIRKIPGIGEKTYLLLRNMGILHISTLQQMDVFAMRRVLGKNGVAIWNKANSLDDSPVLPFSEQKSISREITLEQDTIDMVLLKRILMTMVDELTFELRQLRKLTSCITLKIRYSNFDTHTMQHKVPFTSSERVIAPKMLSLFERLYSRRMLIRLVGIKFSEITSGNYQTDLFEDTLSDLRLSQAMDTIRMRYGCRSVVRGATF
ncbi:MAG: DNA polymerase IV [Chitinophagales bacterium]|nr:DNA polymerase IV [Chitinophagales bacterium]MCZ2394268.1 DNA polymerase IV [Chitinophagales bacterium]